MLSRLFVDNMAGMFTVASVLTPIVGGSWIISQSIGSRILGLRSMLTLLLLASLALAGLYAVDWMLGSPGSLPSLF